MMTKVLTLVLITFNLLIVTLHAHGQIVFSETALLKIRPGQVAIHILPVTLTEINQIRQYKVITDSSLNWEFDGPELIDLEPQTIKYLTFSVNVPSSVPAGTLHELKIKLIPLDQPEEIKLTSISLVVISDSTLLVKEESERLAKGRRDSFLTKITNSGNQTEDFKVRLENLSPQIASISTKDTLLNLKPKESKNIVIDVEFQTEQESILRFKLYAKTQSTEYISKVFVMRYIPTSTGKESAHQLRGHLALSDGQVVINQDKWSSNSSQNIDWQLNGPLSDFVTFGSYLQILRYNGNYDLNYYQATFATKNVTTVLGKQLLNDDRAYIINSPINGINVDYTVEELRFGVVAAQMQDENNPFVLFSNEYRPTKNGRIFLNLGTSSQEDYITQGGAEENFKIATLDILPKMSFALSRSEALNQIRLENILKWALDKSAPIIVQGQIFRSKEEKRSEIRGAWAKEFGNKLLAINLEHQNYKMSELEENIVSTSGDISFRFPLKSNITGDIGYQFLFDNYRERHIVPLGLDIRHNKIRQNLSLNLGLGLDKKAEQSKFEPITNLQYSLGHDNSLGQTYANVHFSLLEDKSETYTYILGHRLVRNKLSLMPELGYEIEKNSFATSKTFFAHLDLSYILPSDLALNLSTRYNFSRETKNNFQFNFTINMTPTLTVPEEVSRVFGGSKTGSAQILLCLDINENNLCDQNEKGIGNVEIMMNNQRLITDSKGVVLFRTIQPSRQKLTVNPLSLPNYATLTSKIPELHIRANQTERLSIPLTINYFIQTAVYYDTNENGEWDKGEQFLGNIALNLQGPTARQVKSVKNTLLSIKKLKIGRYKFSINKVLKNYKITSSDTVALTLPEDNSKRIMFGVVYKESERKSLEVSLSQKVVFKRSPALSLSVDSENDQIQELRISFKGRLLKRVAGEDLTQNSEIEILFPTNLFLKKTENSTLDLLIINKTGVEERLSLPIQLRI